MQFLGDIDWQYMFVPTVPLFETFIRGTVVYLSLFIMLRALMKRESGKVGVTNILVLVLLADAAQNAMAGDYQSITDGLLLVATIIGWSYTLDWLSYRFVFFNRLIKPGKLLLVKNGRILPENMKKELITSDELMLEIRSKGYSDLAEVAECYMESNGEVSVLPRKGRPGKDT